MFPARAQFITPDAGSQKARATCGLAGLPELAAGGLGNPGPKCLACDRSLSMM
jgi:hypothetical protein